MIEIESTTEKHVEAGFFNRVSPASVELEGPYECSICGFHVMLDATFLEQVSDYVTCPCCEGEMEVM